MKMKAALINKYGEAGLTITEVERPELQSDDDVLVKIIAASVNPIDWKIGEGQLKVLWDFKMPLILGHDFSGVVTEVGKNVTAFKAGDEVFGKPTESRIGTFAEYIVIHQTEICLKPSNVSFEEAAGVPLVGQTSYQAMLEMMQLKSADKILIQAGAGGIGSIAIQLAKSVGAYVATTTSAKNIELVKGLGADRVIDYGQEKFDEVLADYDYVFDTLGGAALDASFKILKPGGKIVSIAGIPDQQIAKEYNLSWLKQWGLWFATWNLRSLEAKHKVQYRFISMVPNATHLLALKELVAEGKIKPLVDRIFPFDQVQEALDYSRTGRAKGKIIVKVAEQ